MSSTDSERRHNLTELTIEMRYMKEGIARIEKALAAIEPSPCKKGLEEACLPIKALQGMSALRLQVKTLWGLAILIMGRLSWEFFKK